MATKPSDYKPIDPTVFETDYALGAGVVQRLIGQADAVANQGVVYRDTDPDGLFPDLDREEVFKNNAIFSGANGDSMVYHVGRSIILESDDPDANDLTALQGWRYGATAADRDITSIGGILEGGQNPVVSFHVQDGTVVFSRRQPDREVASLSFAAMGVTAPTDTPTVTTGRDFVVCSPGELYYSGTMFAEAYEFWGEQVLGQDVACAAAGPSLSDQYHLAVAIPYDLVFPDGADGRSGPDGYWGLRLTADDNPDEVYYYESRQCRLRYVGGGHTYVDTSVDFLLTRGPIKEGISVVPFPEGLLVRLRNNEFTCRVYRVARRVPFAAVNGVAGLYRTTTDTNLAQYTPGAETSRFNVATSFAASTFRTRPVRVTGPKTTGSVVGKEVLEKQGRSFFSISETYTEIPWNLTPLPNQIFNTIQPSVALLIVPSVVIVSDSETNIEYAYTYLGDTVTTNIPAAARADLLWSQLPASFYTELELNNRDFYPLRDAVTNLEGLGGFQFDLTPSVASTNNISISTFDGTESPLTSITTVGEVTVDGVSFGLPQYVFL